MICCGEEIGVLCQKQKFMRCVFLSICLCNATRLMGPAGSVLRVVLVELVLTLYTEPGMLFFAEEYIGFVPEL